MLGLQKGTVNINLFNSDTNEFSNVDAITPCTDDISSLTAIYANPGRQFQTVQITFDPNIIAANVESIIQDAINVWTAAYGARYDDMKLNINNSGGGTHDITIVITRNY